MLPVGRQHAISPLHHEMHQSCALTRKRWATAGGQRTRRAALQDRWKVRAATLQQGTRGMADPPLPSARRGQRRAAVRAAEPRQRTPAGQPGHQKQQRGVGRCHHYVEGVTPHLPAPRAKRGWDVRPETQGRVGARRSAQDTQRTDPQRHLSGAAALFEPRRGPDPRQRRRQAREKQGGPGEVRMSRRLSCPALGTQQPTPAHSFQSFQCCGRGQRQEEGRPGATKPRGRDSGAQSLSPHSPAEVPRCSVGAARRR